ncbi:RNA polymerase sigma factor [Streptomyces aidingensis]|uniref:RNA polymerase sigma-70 factor, ECF subfamily n=1 Tax=Streptomyces aidingensis TaxID=910347 RepID=A0A1I1HC80_9ACTN|nr:sigma-70 family RNA polymerase sigma factor [Streptomyces aidingensis]SFC21396.1 RNA polymerase sigma-70 factor, ECF subfamily [Streptomyces aidingensis]
MGRQAVGGLGCGDECGDECGYENGAGGRGRREDGGQAPEPEAVARIRAGDGEALAALFREHHAQVYRYLRTRLGGDRDTAEDLASEVFLRALSHIGRYTWTGRDIAAWLMTIARNLLTDHLRSSSFRREVSTADPGARECGHRVVRAAEELVLRELDRREVRAVVARLPEEYRKVIVLQMWGGMSMRQITTTLGRESIGATRVLRFRAMKRLRAQAETLTGQAGRAGRGGAGT